MSCAQPTRLTEWRLSARITPISGAGSGGEDDRLLWRLRFNSNRGWHRRWEHADLLAVRGLVAAVRDHGTVHPIMCTPRIACLPRLDGLRTARDGMPECN
jgi:hypothetical protein